MTDTLVMGAVAYDPKVVTIWDGFRAWLRHRGLELDYQLYSNYERQVEDLVAGRIHAAWNSPLAWVRSRRLAATAGTSVEALAMRDTDRDLTSVVVVRADSTVTAVEDLAARVVATGALDSPQATLLPLHHLATQGLRPGADFVVRRFDEGVGLHGDHIGGERSAARALMSGDVDAACVVDTNHLLFVSEGTWSPGSVRVLTQTPPYDHCNMTVGPLAPAGLVARFRDLLLSMDYADPEVRPLLDLEGLKQWLPARLEGYAQLEAAVDESGFYDAQGGIGAAGYHP